MDMGEKLAKKNIEILELIPDAIVIVNSGGQIIFVNSQAEKVFGYKRDELIGKPVEMLVPERLRDLHVGHRSDYYSRPTPRPMGLCVDIACLRKDGSEFPADISLSPLETEEGFFVISDIRDITVRKKMEEEVRRLNIDLERRIIERTNELAAANKELEAFSYSVSHDLRAPLRSMDGFSQALLEEYTGKLDDQGKDYLGRIRAASQRMAQLIDDMLSLSRVTRSEMHRERVDMGAVAQSIAAELRRAQPERKAEFVVSPGLYADGDAHLLRIALENLLRNAWKFSGKKPEARIEFGVKEYDGRSAFFVRDNGAGFDMAYAGKLFGAFQRLHGMKEFPGTGIGLSIVMRIIHRHGGRIWAEGEVEKGATFYFTL